MARPKDPALEAQRRQQILDVTIELLSEQPFHAVTQEKVGRATKVSKGVVTYYFPTKRDLLVAAIRHYHERTHTMLMELVGQHGIDAREKLQLLIHAAFPSAEDVEREVRFQSEVWSLAKEDDEAREAVVDSYRGFRDACSKLLDEGVKAGTVTTADRDWAYLFIHALIDGLSFQVAVDPTRDLPELRRRLEQIIMSLIAPPP